MKIEERVEKWLEESIRKIRGLKKLTDIDIFCLNVVIAVRTYLASAFLLLEKSLYYPAMANLRIISDLIVKFLWCLQDNTSGETKRRINRWKKATFHKSKKLLGHLLHVVEGDDLKSILKSDIALLDNRIQSIKDDEMPPTTGKGGLFEQIKTIKLFSNLPTDLYPKSYQQFNSAVHIDTIALEKVEVPWNENDVNNSKIYCLYFTYMVVVMLFCRRGEKHGRIDQEFKEAYNELTKLQESK